MPRPPEVSVIFPAYNEEARLERTLRSAATYFAALPGSVELIVVDDGSRDGTSALVRDLSTEIEELRLIRLAANRGKGHAVRTGVVNARGRSILFADADGATPIEEIERLQRALLDGAHLAIGSRALAQPNVQVKARLHRRLIGRSFHLLTSLLTVRGYRDTQCGFKLFRAEVAHDLFSRLRIDGFSFDVELLLMAQLRGYRVAEISVNWEHQPGSRVNLVTDPLRMARDLFVIRGHLVRGHYQEPHVAPLAAPAFDEGRAVAAVR